MSMHRTQLTKLEEDGLKSHGLDIGTPSQLSDAFRQGIAWALSNSTPKVTITTGHCTHKNKPGGCQLHNLQCNYPACDQRVE